MTVNGFQGWTEPDGSHAVAVANPVSGTIQYLPMRDNPSYSEVSVYGIWHRVDIMISVTAKYWVGAPATPLGADFNGADGWSFNLLASGMEEDSLYYIRATGRDATLYRGSSTVLVRNSCSGIYSQGDFDNDGAADISDLFLLINHITMGGSPPVGGAARADANCDNYVNITDVVFFMNYLFGMASSPCY